MKENERNTKEEHNINKDTREIAWYLRYRIHVGSMRIRSCRLKIILKMMREDERKMQKKKK